MGGWALHEHAVRPARMVFAITDRLDRIVADSLIVCLIVWWLIADCRLADNMLHGATMVSRTISLLFSGNMYKLNDNENGLRTDVHTYVRT